MSNWIGPIKYYAHEETDDDPEWEIEQGIKAGVSKELAYHLANTNPLYEVEFDFWVNPKTNKYFVTKVDLGGGYSLERPLPTEDEGTPIHIDEKRCDEFFEEDDGYFA